MHAVTGRLNSEKIFFYQHTTDADVVTDLLTQSRRDRTQKRAL